MCVHSWRDDQQITHLLHGLLKAMDCSQPLANVMIDVEVTGKQYNTAALLNNIDLKVRRVESFWILTAQELFSVQ